MGRRSFLVLLALGAAVIRGGGRASAGEIAMARATGPASQRLIEVARERGRLPVLIELAMTGPAADEPAAIARAQHRLLTDLGVTAAADGTLAGPGITGVKLYETIPFIALTADADALERLMRSRLVVSVQEDSAVPPN
ncbi:MAG: hypothetical protein U1E66_07560 [Rhodospirillales bacterium]